MKNKPDSFQRRKMNFSKVNSRHLILHSFTTFILIVLKLGANLHNKIAINFICLLMVNNEIKVVNLCVTYPPTTSKSSYYLKVDLNEINFSIYVDCTYFYCFYSVLQLLGFQYNSSTTRMVSNVSAVGVKIYIYCKILLFVLFIHTICINYLGVLFESKFYLEIFKINARTCERFKRGTSTSLDNPPPQLINDKVN